MQLYINLYFIYKKLILKSQYFLWFKSENIMDAFLV